MDEYTYINKPGNENKYEKYEIYNVFISALSKDPAHAICICHGQTAYAGFCFTRSTLHHTLHLVNFINVLFLTHSC